MFFLFTITLLVSTLLFNVSAHAVKRFDDNYVYSTGAKVTFSTMTILGAVGVLLYIVYFEQTMV